MASTKTQRDNETTKKKVSKDQYNPVNMAGKGAEGLKQEVKPTADAPSERNPDGASDLLPRDENRKRK
jgi:hypothetical protein